MKNCSAFIIGGSAGSLDVLLKVLPSVKQICFPIILVLHRKPGTDGLLTQLLSSKTSLPVKEIEEKEKIKDNTIYIAPSDYHLLIEKNLTFSLDHSEKVNFSRPSIDVTFQNASDVYKSTLFCLLLSGSNEDGTEGLKTVKKRDGTAIIQNPGSASMSFMPAHAAENVEVDFVLEIDEMANFINQLCQT